MVTRSRVIRERRRIRGGGVTRTLFSPVGGSGFLAAAEIEQLEQTPHVLLRGLVARVELDGASVRPPAPRRSRRGFRAARPADCALRASCRRACSAAVDAHRRRVEILQVDEPLGLAQAVCRSCPAPPSRRSRGWWRSDDFRDDLAQRHRLDGLFQEIDGPELHRAHGVADAAVGGDHQRRRLDAALAHLREHVQAAVLADAQVEHDEIVLSPTWKPIIASSADAASCTS